MQIRGLRPTVGRQRIVSEARLLTRQMHKRVPDWKLQLCIEALNARPIDLARITEVTEIHSLQMMSWLQLPRNALLI